MVALDSGIALHRPTLPRLSIAATAGIGCLVVALGGLALRGFSDNGLRFGSELAWRFTSLVFFVTVIAGPVARLLPVGPFKYLTGKYLTGKYQTGQRRQLIWAFCMSFAVYLGTLLVPNTIRASLDFSMMVFLGIGALLVLAIAFTARPQAAAMLGESARRTILGVGLSTFWAAYALVGLAHLSGPHRPDAYYGCSVSLMLVALLLRFVDRFVQQWKTPAAPVPPETQSA